MECFKCVCIRGIVCACRKRLGTAVVPRCVIVCYFLQWLRHNTVAMIVPSIPSKDREGRRCMFSLYILIVDTHSFGCRLHVHIWHLSVCFILRHLLWANSLWLQVDSWRMSERTWVISRLLPFPQVLKVLCYAAFSGTPCSVHVVLPLVHSERRVCSSVSYGD